MTEYLATDRELMLAFAERVAQGAIRITATSGPCEVIIGPVTQPPYAAQLRVFKADGLEDEHD